MRFFRYRLDNGLFYHNIGLFWLGSIFCLIRSPYLGFLLFTQLVDPLVNLLLSIRLQRFRLLLFRQNFRNLLADLSAFSGFLHRQQNAVLQLRCGMHFLQALTTLFDAGVNTFQGVLAVLFN